MTTLFGPLNFTGAAGTALINTDMGTGGSMSAGAGTAKFAAYTNTSGLADSCAQFLGQKSGIIDGTFPTHVFLSMTFQWPGTPFAHPSAGYTMHRLMNNAGNTTVAGIKFGSAGSISISTTGDVNVDQTKGRLDFTDGNLYVLEWEVDQVNLVQHLSIYDRNGYRVDKINGACASTATVLNRGRFGVNDNVTDAKVNLDNLLITDAYVQSSFPAKALFYSNTLPTQSSFQVNAVTTGGVTQTRLRIPARAKIGDVQTPNGDNLSTHSMTALAPNTRYDWVLEAFLLGAWTQIASGSQKTACPTAGPGTYRLGTVGCTNNYSTASGAWDHVMTRNLDELWHVGDWHYFNDDVDNSQGQAPDTWDIYFWDYLNQWNAVTGMKGVLANWGYFPTPSDHTWGNNWNTGGDPAVLNHDTAWRKLWPNYKSPLASEQALCYAWTTGNGIRHIVTDFRSYSRTNSDDGTIPYNDPRRKAFGPQQMAWLLAEINNPAWRFIDLRFDPVILPNPVGLGYPPELHNKTDAMPSYLNDLQTIVAAIEGKPHWICFGDQHAVSATGRAHCRANGLGDVFLVGAAGTDATDNDRHQDSNGNPIVGVYEQVFPAVDAPNHGNIRIGLWGEGQIVDNVTSITASWTGWDVLTTPGTPIARVQLSETWAVKAPKVTGGGFQLPIRASLDGVGV